jgi:hypothetical protein
VSEHTTVKLAKALGEVSGVPKDMIQRAIDGYYHDYLSPLTFPEMQLVNDLRELASAPATPRNSRPLLREMAQRVIDGEFDASKEESDAWAASPEGQETFRQLVDDSVFGGMVKKMQEGK